MKRAAIIAAFRARAEAIARADERLAMALCDALGLRDESPANDDDKTRARRRAVREPSEPSTEVSDLDRARGRQMLAAMGRLR